jgi:hypothetical protein
MGIGPHSSLESKRCLALFAITGIGMKWISLTRKGIGRERF